MNPLGHTKEPVTVANSNREGSGTLYEILTVQEDNGQYIEKIVCLSLGTNVQTEGVIIGTNGSGIDNKRNNFLVGSNLLEATTLGTPADTDQVIFTLQATFKKGTTLYALTHVAQTAGRQFIAYST